MILNLVILFVVGAFIGSYTNVVRIRGSWKSSLFGRSKCMSCKKPLNCLQLIPIFSYFWCSGKCSQCNSKISFNYLLGEGLMGLLFVLSFLFSINSFELIILLISSFFVVPIVISDMENFEVPEHIVVPFAYTALFIAIVISISTGSVISLFSGLIFALPFYLIWLISGGHAMGLGDAKIALPFGFLLGNISSVVFSFVFTFWIGIIYIFIYFVVKKLRDSNFTFKMGVHVPLVPSMAVSYFIVYITDISFISFVGVIQ